MPRGRADPDSDSDDSSSRRSRTKKKKQKPAAPVRKERVAITEKYKRAAWHAPVYPAKAELRREIATMSDNMRYRDLVEFKRDAERSGMWKWKAAGARAAAEEAELHELTGIGFAKARHRKLLAQFQEVEAQRCTWSGFNLQGDRALCTRKKTHHAKNHAQLPYCGLHVLACVRQWPMGDPCVQYTPEHANSEGLCLTHFKSVHMGANPPPYNPKDFPGIAGEAEYHREWQEKLDAALRVPHPWAPKTDDTAVAASARVERSEMDEANEELAQYFKQLIVYPVYRKVLKHRFATRIQSKIRQFLARRQALALKRHLSRLERDAAATVMQRGWRAKATRNRVRLQAARMHMAAWKIARAWRASNVQQASKRKAAAVRISAWYKQLRIQKMFVLLRYVGKMHAIRVKRIGMQQAALHEMLKWEIRERAIVTIQRVERGRSARHRARLTRKVYKWAVNVISAWWIVWLQHAHWVKTLRQARFSATQISKVIRGFLDRRRVARKWRRETDTATHIQAWWRGERDRALARHVITQVELGWHWFTPAISRAELHKSLPRADYGTVPVHKSTNMHVYRRGTLFKILPRTIPVDQALWMQLLEDGKSRGPNNPRSNSIRDVPKAKVLTDTDKKLRRFIFGAGSGDGLFNRHQEKAREPPQLERGSVFWSQRPQHRLTPLPVRKAARQTPPPIPPVPADPRLLQSLELLRTNSAATLNNASSISEAAGGTVLHVTGGSWKLPPLLKTASTASVEDAVAAPSSPASTPASPSSRRRPKQGK